MTDATFKTASAEATEVQGADHTVISDPKRVVSTEVEAPFTMYKQKNKLPFTADYFEAKLTWDEKSMVGDIDAVENYLTELVMSGKLEDSNKAAKEKLKGIEKMAGIDKLESKAQRLMQLSEFVKYLKTLERRKNDKF
jgi:hypothetical protein